MSDRAIDNLIGIINNIVSVDLKIKIEDSLVKSPTVFDEICRLLEYSMEIVSLVRHNPRYAKTNAVLLRVLVETLVKILVIKKHVLRCTIAGKKGIQKSVLQDIVDKQEDIIKSYELKYCKEVVRQCEKKSEILASLKKNLAADDADITNIKNIEEEIEKNKGKCEEKINELREHIRYKDVLDLVESGSVFKQILWVFSDGGEKAQYNLLAYYQNCSGYIHLNNTLSMSQGGEKVTDMSSVEYFFAIILLDINEVLQNLNDEEKVYLTGIVDKGV